MTQSITPALIVGTSSSTRKKASASSKPKTKLGGKKVNFKLSNGKKKKASKSSSKPDVPQNPSSAPSRAMVKQLVEDNKAFAMSSASSRGADDYITTKADDVEVIAVNINPRHLYQYIHGYLSTLLVCSDRPYDTKMIPKMSLYYMQYMQYEDMNNNEVPAKLFRLAQALTPRKVGRYYYSPNWNGVNAAVTAVTSAGAQATVWQDYLGVSISYVDPQANVPDANGFVPVSYNPYIAFPTIPEINAFNSVHAATLSILSPDKIVGKEDYTDASAFAWDPSAHSPVSYSPTLDTRLVFITCCVSAGANYQVVEQTSTACLETKIKRPQFAAIRLGTYTPGDIAFKASPGATMPYASRRAVDSIPVNCSPGLLGYVAAYRKLGNFAQLKLCPSIGALNGIAARIEWLIFAASLTGSFAAQDVQILSWMIWKRHLRRYAGVEVGTWSLTPAGAIGDPETYGLHMDDTMLDAVKVPEPIQRFLGAQTAFLDKEGALVPWCARVTAGPYSVATSLTYGGTPVYGPYVSSTSESNKGLSRTTALVSRWKAQEYKFAQYCNMLGAPAYGPSYLDASLILDGSSNFMGVLSRRPMTANNYSTILNLSGAMSYVYTTSGVNVPDAQGMIAQTNRQYRQRYRKDSSGYDTYAGLIALSTSDGYVAAGINPSNIQPNYGPDDLPGPEEYDYDTDARALQPPSYGMKEVFSPKWGMYCGAGYSAGQKGGNPLVKNGKYLVPPSSAEDALCKVHDEAYLKAAGDVGKRTRADREFYEGLDKLDHNGKLTILGKLAKAYFNPSLWLGLPSEK